jgi:hypothetical protein
MIDKSRVMPSFEQRALCISRTTLLDTKRLNHHLLESPIPWHLTRLLTLNKELCK